MSEAEFERRQGMGSHGPSGPEDGSDLSPSPAVESEPAATRPAPSGRGEAPSRDSRARAARAKPSKPKRVQRMFALEEELDKKLWLYAIHVGKDRSDVVNDLLRPVVASMVLYDSRDRRAARQAEPTPEGDGAGE